jgi:hypothetical protein
MKRRLSIQALRRMALRRRLAAKKRRIAIRCTELASESESESESETESELNPKPELTQSALGDSLEDYATWLSTKTSAMSQTRNLSHATALFCWLANSLSIGEAAMFGKLVFIPLLIFNIFLKFYQYT